MEVGKLIIKTKIDNSDVDGGVTKLKAKLEGISKKISGKFATVLSKGLGKIAEIGGKLGTVFLKVSAGALKIAMSLGVGLGVIGLLVAGAMILAKAFKKVFEENEQLKTNLQYIVFAIGKAIEPAVNAVADVLAKIINFLIKIIQYSVYLINAWFGWNPFKDATAEAFEESMKNAEKSTAKTAKNAKEIKKQLAGFDEMNVLSDNGGTSAGGVSGGGLAPSINLANLEDMEVPEWLLTIEKIGKWILDNWEDVVFALLLTKMFIDLLTGNWIGVVIDFVGLLIIAFFKLKDAIKVIWEEGSKILGMFVVWISDHVIKPIGEFFGNLWKGVKEGVANAIQWIKDKFNAIKEFFKGIINTIIGLFKTIGTTVGNVIGSAFKTVINGVLTAIESILNFPIRQINKLLDVINKVPNINLGKLSTFNLPRLARGTILNAPGKGVPVAGGSAIAGEAGREAYLPLSDTHLLEELGSTIGKYVVINATVPVYVGNRLVMREMKRINAEDNFAYNK